MSMPERRRLLILGGTRDAAVLAQEAVTRWGYSTDVISSLAGRTSTPVEIVGAVRTGGFGGVDAMAAYLEAEHVTAVIDATHPFAAQISANAAAACDQTGTPRVLLKRPMWERQHGDLWHMVADAAQAAGMLDRFGHRAFLTTGRTGLDCFAGCTGAWFLVRLVELPIGPLPLADYHVIADRGPFTVDGEKALLERHEIDVIVCKASGGEMTRAKLDAARILGLPVVMIARPPLPDGPQAGSVSAVLTWLGELLA
jgi:precorrin-6A/cobalt-precorrin-6A reductase